MANPHQPIQINWPTFGDPRIGVLLVGQRRIFAMLDQILKGETMSATITQQMDDAITALQADVQAQSGVVASNTALLNGFAAQLAAALAAAQNSGATPAELASVQALHDSLVANTDGLVQAAAANPLPAATP